MGYIHIFMRELQRRVQSYPVPCSLCGGRKVAVLHKIPNVRNAFFKHFFAETIVQCSACGFVFTSPRLSPKALERYYSSSYRLEGLDIPRNQEEFLSQNYSDIWVGKDREINLVLKYKQGGNFLDVGCASGSLLYLAREAGFDVHGVEVSERAARFVREELGINIFVGQLAEARFQDGTFDVATCIHTLEHFPDPKLTVTEVYRILKNDGVLIGVVPNLASWTAERNGADWKWLQPGNHYSHFTPDMLRLLLESVGFNVELYTEEGRYEEMEISAYLSREERQNVGDELRGSEIVFIGKKNSDIARDTLSDIELENGKSN